LLAQVFDIEYSVAEPEFRKGLLVCGDDSGWFLPIHTIYSPIGLRNSDSLPLDWKLHESREWTRVGIGRVTAAPEGLRRTFGYLTLMSFFTSPIVVLVGSENVATYGKSGARLTFLPGGPAAWIVIWIIVTTSPSDATGDWFRGAGLVAKVRVESWWTDQNLVAFVFPAWARPLGFLCFAKVNLWDSLHASSIGIRLGFYHPLLVHLSITITRVHHKIKPVL
jgi:hypothetical protein